MNTVMILIRMLLLAISCCGYLCRLSRQVRAEFSVGILFSLIGAVLFVAGFLNILQPTAWLLFTGGFCCGIREFRKKQKPAFLCNTGILFFGGMAVFFLILLHDSSFIHYDNFSHWAVAPRVLTLKNAFPNFADTNIFFQDYPLGSACCLYYFAEILGSNEEWILMWAQAVLQVGMIISLFAFCKSRLHILFTAVSILMLLCSNIAFTDLLVDTLLPLAGFSAIAFVIYYSDALAEKLFYTIPYTVFLVSIKNSGLLFAVYVLTCCLAYIPAEKDLLKKWLISAAVPFWQFTSGSGTPLRFMPAAPSQNTA